VPQPTTTTTTTIMRQLPQVARTAAIFCVDELVIVDDTPQRKDGTVSAGAAFLARVAQYLETPQYLRKALIPMHPDLRLAGAAVAGARGCGRRRCVGAC
jgi:predicted SPOUT superfamily RNA methylase MTH1